MIPQLESFLKAALSGDRAAEVFVDIIDSLVTFNMMSIADQEKFLGEVATRWVLTGRRGKRLPTKKAIRKRLKKPPKSVKTAVEKLLNTRRKA